MNTDADPTHHALSPRREFLKKAAAAVVGGVVMLVPLAAGLLVWLDPVRKRKAGGGAEFIDVTSLSAVPPDNEPRKFQVITDRVDAWTKTPQVPIGAVFLKQSKEGVVTAWNVVCPHAGCFVEIDAKNKGFLCPCHNSRFAPDGAIVPEQCVSPRGMDTLDVDPNGLKNGLVRIRYQNFAAGIHEKRPVT